MARYIGPTCKLARREGVDLSLKSTGIENKCKLNVPPGVHGPKIRERFSTFKRMLREKQKLRRIYGLLEKQFRRVYQSAERLRGSTGDNLISLLESRLDNVVYRMGFASTRAEARQLVTHRAVMVNGKILNIPSYRVIKDDVISIKEKAKSQLRIKASLEAAESVGFVDWVTVDTKAMEGKFHHCPVADEINLGINLNLVVEFYSR